MESPRKMYAYAFVVGLSLQLPFFTYTTASNYFNYLFPDRDIEYYFGVSLSITYALGQVFNLYYAANTSFFIRTVASLAVLLFCIVLTPFVQLVQDKTRMSLEGTFWLMNTIVFIGTFASSVGQSAMYGLLGKFEQQNLTQGVQAGGVWGAVLVAVVRVISEAAIPNKQTLSGILYFSIDAFVLFVGILCVLKFFSNPHIRLVASGFFTDSRTDESQHLLTLANDSKKSINIQEEPLTFADYWGVIKTTFAPCFSIFFVFAVTFLLFPGVTSVLHRNDNWVTIWTMVCFNVGDAIGKSIPGFAHVLNKRTILIGNFIHALFIPLYIFVLKSEIWPVVFDNQFYTYVIVFGLGLSTGYFTCSGMIIAPGMVQEGRAKSAVGNITFFWFSMGIFVGAAFGMVIMFVL